MKIDNSTAKLFWFCPLAVKERYVNNLEAVGERSSLHFGTRVHQLLELRHLRMADRGLPVYPELADPALEAEAQLTFAAYEAFYPEEPFEVVDVEKYFEVPLKCLECDGACRSKHHVVSPDTWHIYHGEFDAIVRMKNSGRLWLLETKTEKRGGKDNLPDSWQQKSQVGLYLWAAEQVYKEEFEGILLNIITRQSPKGQERCGFRRDHLHRSRAQQRESVENITWVADRLEECQRSGYYPTNRNNCVSPWGWKCEYSVLHSTEERSEALVQIKYKQAEKYLSGL